MYYTIILKGQVDRKDGKIYRNHNEVSEAINRMIINHSIPSNFTTKNIIANWLSRNNKSKKSKKWDFVSVSKIVKKIP